MLCVCELSEIQLKSYRIENNDKSVVMQKEYDTG